VRAKDLSRRWKSRGGMAGVAGGGCWVGSRRGVRVVRVLVTVLCLGAVCAGIGEWAGGRARVVGRAVWLVVSRQDEPTRGWMGGRREENKRIFGQWAGGRGRRSWAVATVHCGAAADGPHPRRAAGVARRQSAEISMSS